jgi:hypothetical protein
MSPACLLAPELAEVIGYGVISRFRERFIGAFAESVVSLRDLPYYLRLDRSLGKNFERLTMSVNRYGFAPSEAH